MKKIFFLINFCFLLLSVSCVAQRKTQLVMWAMGEEGLRLPEVIKIFENENPEIQVNIQQIPWSAAHEKLITATVGGMLPDVCQLGTTWMSEFKTIGVLEQIDNLIFNSNVIKKEKYFSGSWNTCVIEGKTYGVPWYVETRVMFYRKDLFEKAGVKKPPETWDELIKFGEKLVKKKNNKIEEYAYAIPLQDWQVLCPFIWQNGGDIIDERTRTPLVTDPKVKEAFQFYVGMFQKNLTPTGAAGIDLLQSFRTGYYKMFFSGPWMINIINRDLPELQGKWDVALLPKKVTRTSFVGGSNLVIFNQSKNKQAAWKLIEFLSREDIQLTWYKITSDLPSVRSVWEKDEIKQKPMLKVFAQQLEDARSVPNIPEWEQVAKYIHTRIEEAILQQKNLDSILSELNKDIKRVLSKKR